MDNIQHQVLRICKDKSNRINYLLFWGFAVIIILNGLYGTTAYAYGSWVTDTGGQNIYGVAPVSGSSTPEDGTSTDTFTKKILNFCLKLPDGIRNALTGDGYNFSLDGIILGRLAVGGSGNSVNYTGFDMSDGNLYGAVGAVIYKTLRAVVLGGMLLMYMYMLATHVFKSGEKSRAELKESLMRLVIMFLLIYIMPQLVDIVIYLRDFVLNLVYRGMTTSGMVDANNMGTNAELITVYRDMAYSESGFGFFTFLLYLGVCIGCIFFLWEYMKIAIIQMMLFAIYPVVALLSVHNKKLFSDWWGMFFSNCLIPVMDYSLLLIPVFIGEAMGEVHPMLSAIMQVAIIAQTVPARNAMLRIFSNATGIAAGGGFGGLGMLGMMAMAALRRKAFNGSTEGGQGLADGDPSNADLAQDMSENFQREFPSIPDYVRNEGDTQDTGIGIADTASDQADIMSASDESVRDLVADGTEEGIHHIGDDAEEEHTEEMIPSIDTSDDVFESERDGIRDAEEALNTLPDGAFNDGTYNNDVEQITENELPLEPVGTDRTLGTEPPLGSLTEQTSENTQSTNLDHIMPHQSPVLDQTENSLAGKGKEPQAVPQKVNGGMPVYQQEAGRADISGSQNTYDEPKSLHRFNTLRVANLERLDRANQQAEGLQNKMNSLNEAHKKNEMAYSDRRAEYEEAKIEYNSAKMNYETASKEHGFGSNEAQEAKVQYQSVENEMHEKQKRVEEARKNARESQAEVDKQKTVIEANRKEIKKAEVQEEKFANTAGQYGMRDTKYTTAADFTRQRKIDEIKRTHANYKNFNSSGFKNSLSPEEKAAFSREQQLHERHKKVSKAVAVAGTLAGGAAGTVIGSFGGDKGMKAGAMMGGVAGGSTAAGAARLAETGIEAARAAVQTADDGKINRKNSSAKKSEQRVQKSSGGVRRTKAEQTGSRGGNNSRMKPGEMLDRRAEKAAEKDQEISKLL